MTYEQIVERIENILKVASAMAEANKMYPKSVFLGIYPEIFEFINRQQAEIEKKDRLIDSLADELHFERLRAFNIYSAYHYGKGDDIEKIYPLHEAKSKIEDLTERLNATIAGQETLQKALAEKDREIERLTAEKDSLIKTFGECQAEAVRGFAKAVLEGLADKKITKPSDMFDFTADYFNGKEMAGNKE